MPRTLATQQRPDGELVFPEINPRRQYLFVEIQTNQELSRALAQQLSQASVA